MTIREFPAAGACPAPRRSPGPRASAPAGTQAAYCRVRDLPRLLALWPHEIEDPSPAAHVRLVAKLRAALRAERQRGLSGHWTYDLARHRHLLAAYRAEHALLTAERVAVRRAEGEARGP
jgi:hypothetical protein